VSSVAGPAHPFEVVALGYRYPNPSWAKVLSDAVDSGPSGVVGRHMKAFVGEVTALSLGEWEELHTATLDLSAPFVPYVGHVIWGENYRRGEFMSELMVDMNRLGFDLGGELPDHIEPLLRFMALTPDLSHIHKATELIEVVPGAVKTMLSSLTKADSKNPYRHLVAATVEVCADLQPLTIGVNR